MVKKMFIVMLLSIVLVIMFSNVAMGSNINIMVDEKHISFPDQKPYVDKNNRTLVPVRFIVEELGAKVYWDGENNLVAVNYDGETIKLKINSKQALIYTGGQETVMDFDTSVVLRNGRVMVPLRVISEIMGSTVVWEEETRTIGIHSAPKSKPDSELIAYYSRLDEDILARIQKMNSYFVIKKWQKDTSITSNGQYKELVESIDINDLGDYFYFEYDAKGLDDIWWISIYLSSDRFHNNYFYYDLTQDALKGSNKVIINKSNFLIGAGKPDWSKIKYLRIAFQSNADKTVTIQPSILSAYKASPLCTLWFDDGWEDTYSNAHRIASSIDPSICGQVAIVPRFIGTSRYLNRSQLNKLLAAGWEISNHTYSHRYLTDLPAAEINKEILKAYSYVSAVDPKGAYHLAVPYSSINNKVLTAVKENTLSARYYPDKLNQIPFDRYELAFKEVTNLTEFETVKMWIDQAIEDNRWVILLFHRIDDQANNQYAYQTESFAKIIEYLHLRKNDIKTVTVSRAFEEAGYLPIPK